MRVTPAAALTVVLLQAVQAGIVIEKELLESIAKYNRDLLHRRKNTATPVEIEVSFAPKPRNYKESKAWTVASVARLLKLLKKRIAAASLYRTLKQLSTEHARRVQPNAEMVYLPQDDKKGDVIQENLPQDKKKSDVIPEIKELLRAHKDSVLQIDNNMKVKLPSSRIDVNTILDYIPDRKGKKNSQYYVKTKNVKTQSQEVDDYIAALEESLDAKEVAQEQVETPQGEAGEFEYYYDDDTTDVYYDQPEQPDQPKIPSNYRPGRPKKRPKRPYLPNLPKLLDPEANPAESEEGNVLDDIESQERKKPTKATTTFKTTKKPPATKPPAKKPPAKAVKVPPKKNPILSALQTVFKWFGRIKGKR